MSFLSSHRLHWGVHHELSDSFWVQLDQMIHDASNASTPQSAPTAGEPVNALADTHKPTSSHNQEPEALGP